MKKLTEEQLDQVRAHLATNERWFSTTAESVGEALGFKKHIVKQAFHRLNLEGVMGIGVNRRGYDYTTCTRYYQREPSGPSKD